MEVPAKFKSVLAGSCYWLLAFIFVATSTFIVSCGGGGTSVVVRTNTTTTTTTVAPTEADTLDFDTTATVVAGETYTIEVLATSAGTPVNGETISFQITQGQSGGDVDGGTTAYADTVNGVASAVYTAGTLTFYDPPVDIVTINSTNLSGTVTITVTPPVVDSVTVTPLETELYAIGTDRTTIVALVEAEGTGVAGVDVDFTSSAGSICASGTLDADPCNAAQPLTATTDSEGKARIILQSSTNLETATVEAQASSVSGSETVDFVVGPADDINLFASPTNITADNGISTSNIIALVTDAAGHTVADGVSVTFTVLNTSVGTGGFGAFLLPTASAETAGGFGLATQTFIAGDTAGVIDILAEVGSVDSGTTGDDLITLIAQSVASVTIELGTGTLTADGSDSTEVTATLRDTNGNLMGSGTPVNFATTGGGLDDVFPIVAPAPTASASTDASGVATVYLQSSIVAGSYSVSATSGSKTDIASVVFEAGVADATASSLSVSPDPIPANGASTATMTLIAQDANGNPVADGKTVTFSSDDAGAVISDVTTTSGGIATAVITSSYSVGTVNLSAQIDSITETTTIDFGATSDINPSAIDLSLSATTIPIESPAGSNAVIITATVNDSTGQPIQVDCPDNIEFEIIAGPTDAELDNIASFGSYLTKTTVDGVATASLTAGATPGTVRVQVRATMDTGSCTALGTPVSVITTPITIASGEAAVLNLFPESEVLILPGDYTGQIFNAQVTDAYGNPVADGTSVYFWLDDDTEGFVCPYGETGHSISEVDSGCSSDSVVINGVARTLLSYAPSYRWATFTLNAETAGGTPNDSYGTTEDAEYLPAAPISLTVEFPNLAIANTVDAGTQDILVRATYKDGAAIPFDGYTIHFSSDRTDIVQYDPGGNTDSDVTDAIGVAEVYIDTPVPPGTCIPTTDVVITASEDVYSGTQTLTVNGSEPEVTIDSVSGDPDVSVSATVTADMGTITSYDWNFAPDYNPAADAPGYDGPAASYTFTTNGSYTISLEVTSSTGCTATAIKPVTISNHTP